jgi:hypothetical protein
MEELKGLSLKVRLRGVFAGWERSNLRIEKLGNWAAKWRRVLKNDLKIENEKNQMKSKQIKTNQNEMKYFKMKRKISKWKKKIEKEAKFFKMKRNILKWNEMKWNEKSWKSKWNFRMNICRLRKKKLKNW